MSSGATGKAEALLPCKSSGWTAEYGGMGGGGGEGNNAKTHTSGHKVHRCRQTTEKYNQEPKKEMSIDRRTKIGKIKKKARAAPAKRAGVGVDGIPYMQENGCRGE